MHTKARIQAAKAMARIGVAALRFNFAASAGARDVRRRPGEQDDFRAALDFARRRATPGLRSGRPACRSARGSR